MSGGRLQWTGIDANQQLILPPACILGESADVRGRRWRPGADIWLVTSIHRDVGQD